MWRRRCHDPLNAIAITVFRSPVHLPSIFVIYSDFFVFCCHTTFDHRHSAEVKQRLHSSHANGISSSNHPKSTRSISLLTILLTIYCKFCCLHYYTCHFCWSVEFHHLVFSFGLQVVSQLH